MGFVAEIDFEMYDIAVQVKPSEQLSRLENTSINFHIAYVDTTFTQF